MEPYSDSDEEAAQREIAEVESAFEMYSYVNTATGGGAKSIRALQMGGRR
jgi:hypothetical protein